MPLNTLVVESENAQAIKLSDLETDRLQMLIPRVSGKVTVAPEDKLVIFTHAF